VEQLNLAIYFYTFAQSNLAVSGAKPSAVKLPNGSMINEIRREKLLTIRATQGSNFVAPHEIVGKKAGIEPYISVGEGATRAAYYDRYISQLAFSRDEKYVAFVLRNGPQDFQVHCYDFLDRKPRKVFVEKFDKEVKSVEFMPRDSSKLLVAGENMFLLFGVGRLGITDPAEYEGLPVRPAKRVTDGGVQQQCFNASCFMENDLLIGCSNQGDIFVVEGMQVIQVIDAQQLVTPGSKVGSRLDFQFIVPCRFGFIVSSPDVLYFFRSHAAKDKEAQGKLQYSCILKWRAPEFIGTRITALSVQEGDE
jgi:hypothetical protein